MWTQPSPQLKTIPSIIISLTQNHLRIPFTMYDLNLTYVIQLQKKETYKYGLPQQNHQESFV